MAEAVGILEVFGLATAFVAGDAGCKAANVRLEVFDKNKPANADSLQYRSLSASNIAEALLMLLRQWKPVWK